MAVAAGRGCGRAFSSRAACRSYQRPQTNWKARVTTMEQPLLDVLMRHAYPELAQGLRARIGRIVERWTALVRQSVPQADELTFAQLTDDLPIVLEQQARALEADRA